MNFEDCNIQITNAMTPETLDKLFIELWKPKHKVHLVMDTTRCDISLRKALSLKNVLDKHREHSKKYVDHTTIIVKSRMVRTILNMALHVLRPERPVNIHVQ